MRKRRSFQEIADDFEQELRDFLGQLGFKLVNGGRAHKIGGHQIDASGVHDQSLLVVECVLRTKGPSQSLRAKIRSVKGISYDVKRAIRTDRRYAHISKVCFILATTKTGVRREDVAYAKRHPEVFVWDENFISYYRSLYQKIGAYARYNLLAELNIKPTEKRILQIPCMRTKILGHTLYSFFAPPRDLLELTYVARRGMAREEYYQRLVDKSRIVDIAKEFLNRNGIFPNSVLLSFNKPPQFTRSRATAEISRHKPKGILTRLSSDVEFGYLRLPHEYRSCWIIDGQHRLYSFAFAKRDAKQSVCVIAFENISLTEQAKYFVEINSNQKPVPADLLWDLKGELMPKLSDGMISNVVKRLNQTGVLKGKIYLPSAGMKVPGEKLLRFAGMCINIKRRKLLMPRTEHMNLLSDHNPLYRRNPDVLLQRGTTALRKYFSVVNKTFSSTEKKEFWLQNSGVSILVALYECIVRRVRKVPSETELKLYMKTLRRTFRDQHDDIKTLRLNCTSEGGRTKLAREFASRIGSLLGDPDFKVPAVESEFERNVGKFERGLSRFLVDTLRAATAQGEWTKERIPGGVRERLMSKSGKMPQDIHEDLTLGECKEIIQQKNNWEILEPYFVRDKGFASKDHLMIALEHVIEHRNAAKHERQVKAGYEGEGLRDIYFRKLTECVAIAVSAMVTPSQG